MAAMTMDSGQCTLGTTTTPAFTKARSGIKGTNYICIYLINHTLWQIVFLGFMGGGVVTLSENNMTILLVNTRTWAIQLIMQV